MLQLNELGDLGKHQMGVGQNETTRPQVFVLGSIGLHFGVPLFLTPPAFEHARNYSVGYGATRMTHF